MKQCKLTLKAYIDLPLTVDEGSTKEAFKRWQASMYKLKAQLQKEIHKDLDLHIARTEEAPIDISNYKFE